MAAKRKQLVDANEEAKNICATQPGKEMEKTPSDDAKPVNALGTKAMLIKVSERAREQRKMYIGV